MRFQVIRFEKHLKACKSVIRNVAEETTEKSINERFLAPREFQNKTDDELRTRQECNKSTLYLGRNTFNGFACTKWKKIGTTRSKGNKSASRAF